QRRERGAIAAHVEGLPGADADGRKLLPRGGDALQHDARLCPGRPHRCRCKRGDERASSPVHALILTPRNTASAVHAAATAAAANADTPAKSQPASASPPREMTVAMKFCALERASGGTSVKSVSRAGLEIANSPTLRMTPKAMSAVSVGVAPSQTKPATESTGTAASMP